MELRLQLCLPEVQVQRDQVVDLFGVCVVHDRDRGVSLEIARHVVDRHHPQQRLVHGHAVAAAGRLRHRGDHGHPCREASKRIAQGAGVMLGALSQFDRNGLTHRLSSGAKPRWGQVRDPRFGDASERMNNPITYPEIEISE